MGGGEARETAKDIGKETVRNKGREAVRVKEIDELTRKSPGV